MLLLDATFIGRFHPLVVHLPIGFLILGVLMEWLYKGEQAQKIVAFSWLIGGVSAMVAALFGWLLANEGGYDEQTLFWHRWLGIGLMVTSFIGWAIKSNIIRLRKTGNHILNFGIIAALGVVGHLGGNMTHGSDYLLENAPKPLKALLGSGEAEEEEKIVLENPDSVYFYADLIKPIFEAKCMRCHDEQVKRGGLNMASIETIQEGGDHGEVIEAGSATESELFRRVTLLPNHAKYMPLKGTPMTFQEIKLLEWWLDSGADFETRLTENKVPKGIQSILLEEYGLDLSEKSYYEKLKVAAAAESVIQAMEKAGFKVETLATDNSLLEVSYKGKETPNLEVLLGAKEQIVWLNLRNTNLSDAALAPLAQLPNLTRLRLEENAIGDAALTHLSSLKHLESLNLHHTNVSDAGLATIEKIVGLKRVYLWETQVTKESVEDLKSKRPKMEIDLGISFAKVVPTK